MIIYAHYDGNLDLYYSIHTKHTKTPHDLPSVHLYCPVSFFFSDIHIFCHTLLVDNQVETLSKKTS